MSAPSGAAPVAHRVRLAAFPKCWIELIVSGEMSVLDWIDRSVELEPEGLELYAGFLTSLESRYLGEVRRRIDDGFRSAGQKLAGLGHGRLAEEKLHGWSPPGVEASLGAIRDGPVTRVGTGDEMRRHP